MTEPKDGRVRAPVRKRTRPFKTWHAAQEALYALARSIDLTITKATKDDGSIDILELPSITDLKLRVSKELRENYLADLRGRREEIDLADLTEAYRRGESLLKRIEERMEERVESLLKIDGLATALSVPTPGAPTGTPAADNLPEAPPDPGPGSPPSHPDSPETHVPQDPMDTIGPEEGGPLGEPNHDHDHRGTTASVDEGTDTEQTTSEERKDG